MEDHEPWVPLSIGDMQEVMAGFPASWWIAGGWAVDLSLGRQTRPHRDTDVAVLRRDQPTLFNHLRGWDVQIVAGGMFSAWRDGDWLEGGERFQFWVRRGAGAPWAFEILLEETEDDDWLYRRNPAVRLPLTAFGAKDAAGTPHVSLPIALLYKSNRPTDARNAADFESALPTLDAASRRWLAQALAEISSGHPWTSRLAPDG